MSVLNNNAMSLIGTEYEARSSLKSIAVSEGLTQQFRLMAMTAPTLYLDELTSTQAGYIIKEASELKAEATYCLVNAARGAVVVHNAKGTNSVKPTARQFGCGEDSKVRMQPVGAGEDNTFVIWFSEISRAFDLDSSNNLAFGDFGVDEQPSDSQIWNLDFMTDVNKGLGLFHVKNVSKGRWLTSSYPLGEGDSSVGIIFTQRDYTSQQFLFMVTDNGSG